MTRKIANHNQREKQEIFTDEKNRKKYEPKKE